MYKIVVDSLLGAVWPNQPSSRTLPRRGNFVEMHIAVDMHLPREIVSPGQKVAGCPQSFRDRKLSKTVLKNLPSGLRPHPGNLVEI